MSDTITIFELQSTKDGSPQTKTFTLGYDAIQNAILKVQLLADTPLLNIYGWKITKILVNSVVFFPSDSQNSTNLIQDVNNINQYFHNVLIPSGDNTISISFEAPIGAGVISPSVNINAQLIVTGNKSALGSLGLNGLPTFSDLFSKFQQSLADNIPLAIAFLILVAVIIVSLAYLIGKISLPKLPEGV